MHLKRSGDAVGTLVIDNSLSGGAAWTPLGVPGTNDMVIPDVVVIRGSKTMVSAEHSGLVLHFLSPVIVTNAAYVSMPGSSLDLQAAPVISGGGRVEVSGGFFVSVPLDLANGGQVRVDGAVTSSVPVTVSGSTLAVDELWAPGLSVVSGGVVNCLASTAGQMHKLGINVSGAVWVDGTSKIDVSGLGYLAGRTSGNTTVGAASGASGGSYGGLGGNHSGSANAVYGDYADPNDWGSGSSAGQGNAGGGLVRVTAGSLQLEGVLLANGSGSSSGSGSGGGVYVAVNTLSGSGSIQAKGGSSTYGYGGGGGRGGRVAVYAGDWSGFNVGGITAPGGTGTAGGAGTVYLKRSGDAVGTLVIDNSLSGGAAWTPLGVPGTRATWLFRTWW